MNFAKRQKFAISFFLILLLGILIGYGFGRRALLPLNTAADGSGLAAPPHFDADLDLTDLSKVWKILRDKYVDPSKISKETLSAYAVKGLVGGLKDPYSVFMTADESKEFDSDLNGELEGIGAELELKDGRLIVVTPLKSSPAERSGLKPHDVIVKINGEETAQMSIAQAVKKIKGQKGTSVTLTISREAAGAAFDVIIVRDAILIPSVTLKEVAPGIFDIAVNQFGDKTKDEFLKVVNEILLKKPARGKFAVILDLRFNGGGFLDMAVDMLSIFLPDKKVAVKIRKRAPAGEEILVTSGGVRLPDEPLVVLVNKGSASASEIVAGALQDYKRGVIMGEQSFGKGSVQEIEPLEDGSALRFTIAKWFTPLDRTINEIGVTPDIIVATPKTDQKSEAAAANASEEEKLKSDIQLQSAIQYLEENVR